MNAAQLAKQAESRTGRAFLSLRRRGLHHVAVTVHHAGGGLLAKVPKACVLDAQKVKGMAKEEVLYGLYYELAMSGMDHEITAGRVVLPRWLYLVKDADDGTDVLRLPELQRRLTERCREYFKDQVQVDSIITATSDSSLLLQLADLFSGSVGRMYNKVGEAMNQKDEFANFFQKLAGFEFVGDAESDGESVYLRRLI